MSIRGVKCLKFTAQNIHDSQILPDLDQLNGSLFLFDLGYFSHLFLHQLASGYLSLNGIWKFVT